jgi:hypothetical protein
MSARVPVALPPYLSCESWLLSFEASDFRDRRPPAARWPAGFCVRCRPRRATVRRKWTPAHAGKAPRAKQLPESLSAKRTGACRKHDTAPDSASVSCRQHACGQRSGRRHMRESGVGHQLPASLSAKRTAAFRRRAGSASGALFRADFCAGRDNFRDNNGDKWVPRKSRRRIYLGFSPR